jgi:hypothetical protein
MGTPFVVSKNYLLFRVTGYILWNYPTIREIYASFSLYGKNDKKCKLRRFSSLAGTGVVKTRPRAIEPESPWENGYCRECFNTWPVTKQRADSHISAFAANIAVIDTAESAHEKKCARYMLAFARRAAGTANRPVTNTIRLFHCGAPAQRRSRRA